MTISELIDALQAMRAKQGDLPVMLMFDRTGTLPLAEVKTFGVTEVVVQKGGFIELGPEERAKAKLQCTLIAHTPPGWGKK